MKSNLIKRYLKTSNNVNFLIKFQKRFIAQGATFQTEDTKVRLRGKFLKCRTPDMPTLIWLPEILENIENYEEFFTNPEHGILNYRNVWMLYPRNFGDSDHHQSFCLNDNAADIARFMDEKQLSIVTIGGHGYGAKIACAFGTLYLDKTSGVMCIEGGPVDHCYHPFWNDFRDYVKAAYKISESTNNINEALKRIDKEIKHKKWNKIFKQNIIETLTGISWKFNMAGLDNDCRKPRPNITLFDSKYGLFPGRAFVHFASHSQQIYLATNTMPIYKFFPHLQGRFPSLDLNFIQTEEEGDSKFCFFICL